MAPAGPAQAMTGAAMPQHHIVFATAGSLGDLYPSWRWDGNCGSAESGSGRHQRQPPAPVLEAGLAFRHMRPDPENTAAFHARYMHPKTGGQFVYQDYLAPAIRRSYDDLAAATRDADLL